MTDGKTPQRGRPPERIRVSVMKKRRDDAPLAEDVLWPKNWPLPNTYDTVLAGPVAGFVEHIEYDLDSERVVIWLRP